MNFRKVRWTSFQPNFFIQFQPGALDLAPKTFLVTVPRVSISKKNEVQNKIVQMLPNVSIIDVTRLVNRLRGITDQMAWALQFMAFLCLIAGFIVLYSIANFQAQSRQWDVGLLKTLGLDFPAIRSLFLWQFGLIAFFAALLGMGVSLFISYVLSSLLFETMWVYNVIYPTISFVGCVLLALVVTYYAVQRSLKTKSIQLLGLS